MGLIDLHEWLVTVSFVGYILNPLVLRNKSRQKIIQVQLCFAPFNPQVPSSWLVGYPQRFFVALQLNNHWEPNRFLFKTKEARWCHPVLLEQFNSEIGWTNMRHMCILYVAFVSLNGEWRAVNIVFDVAGCSHPKSRKKQDQQVDSQGDFLSEVFLDFPLDSGNGWGWRLEPLTVSVPLPFINGVMGALQVGAP